MYRRPKGITQSNTVRNIFILSFLVEIIILIRGWLDNTFIVVIINIH